MEEYAKTNNLTYTEDPNFDVSEYIFGAKYRASETMPEWFAKQTPEVQAAFYNAEKAIDEVLESFSEMMGLKKNITEYSSWEEVYADLGITMKENTRTAEELRADGFEVCENADGTFIAFKDYAEESAEVQEEFKPVALRAVANALMKTTNTSLAREGGVSGITGGFAFIDANGNEIDYNGEAAGNFDQGVRNAFIGGFGNATEKIPQRSQSEIRNRESSFKPRRCYSNPCGASIGWNKKQSDCSSRAGSWKRDKENRHL